MPPVFLSLWIIEQSVCCPIGGLPVQFDLRHGGKAVSGEAMVFVLAPAVEVKVADLGGLFAVFCSFLC